MSERVACFRPPSRERQVYYGRVLELDAEQSSICEVSRAKDSKEQNRRWKRRPPPLPDAFHAVSVEELFDRYEGQVEGQCLGDQHPVERVAMWTGQPPGALTVVGCNR